LMSYFLIKFRMAGLVEETTVLFSMLCRWIIPT